MASLEVLGTLLSIPVILSSGLSPANYHLSDDALYPVARFSTLQKQNVEAFEQRLIKAAAESVPEDDAAHDELHSLLHRYSEAIADLERMNLRLRLATPKRTPNTDDVEAKAAGSQQDHFDHVGILAPDPSNRMREAIKGPVNFALSTLIQLIFAGTIGGALVAPMLIMVLHPSRNTSLITTCVFVFSFASSLVLFNVMAYLTKAYLPKGWGADALDGAVLQVKDIVGATAAYAAVLVVFVGTSVAAQ